MSNQDWAITIRKHAKKDSKVSETDFNPILDHIGTFMKFHVFEKDKGKDHVHIHGLVRLVKGYKYSKLTLKGFNCKFVKITNLNGWIRYCKKDIKARDHLKFELTVQDYSDQHSDTDTVISIEDETPLIIKRKLFT